MVIYTIIAIVSFYYYPALIVALIRSCMKGNLLPARVRSFKRQIAKIVRLANEFIHYSE